MSHTQSDMPCHYCPDIAAFVVEFRDNDDHRRTCRAHFADGYDEATLLNTQSFLPVYVGRLIELVTT